MNVRRIEAEQVEREGAERPLGNVDGILVPGGFDKRGVAVVEPRFPACDEHLRPLIVAVPLQRLAAEIARLNGGDPDHSKL